MKKTLLIINMAFMLVSLGTICHAEPELTISEDSVDFGIVLQNIRLPHTFWLKSTGDDTLKIIKVIPGCGCIKTPLQTNIIPPGDSTKFEVLYDTRKYRGKITKRPRIRTNEANPDHVITITSQIEIRPDATYPVVVTPYKIDMTPDGNNKPKKRIFTLTNITDKDLYLKPLFYPEEISKVKLPKKIKAGETAEGEIKLSKNGLKQAFEKSFTFEVKGHYTYRFTVPVIRDSNQLIENK